MSVFFNKAIVVWVSVSVFGLTIEICARIDDRLKYDAPFIGDYSENILTNLDCEGIMHNVPDVRFEKWSINQFGFRGPKISVEKPDGTTRIVCMGTSETFGLYESPGGEWPRQLADMLRESECFQVINASVVGLLLNDYAQYIEKYVLKLDPDVVVLCIDPYGYAVGTDKFEKRQRRHKETSSPKKASVMRSFFHIRIVPKTKQAVKGIIPSGIIKKYRLINLERQVDNLEVSRLKGAEPMDAVPLENIEPFKADLKELVDFLEGEQIDVVLCSYPVLISQSNIDEYREIFLDFRRFYIELSFLGLIDASIKFNEIIRSFSQTNGITFVDNAFLLPKDTEYFADNVHYTDKGAKLIAENILDYLNVRWKES